MTSPLIGAGLLHTVPALADTFHQRITALAPDVHLTHVADPDLLATAIATGVDEDVDRRVLAHVRHLVDSGADAVMVTCSSIGESTERAAREVDVPVLRVDEAMAGLAVRHGRVTVLATLESTLGPTGRLLRRLAEGRGVEVRAELVEKDDDRIREAVARAAEDSDVVVLAQASMAAAASGAADVPVLESVSTGTQRLVETLERLADKC